MTDAPTPVVLDEDQGSSAARIPTEGVTASGDEWPTDSYRAIAIELHHTVEELTYGLPEVLREHALADEESLIPKALRTMDMTAFRLANLDVENSPSSALGGTEAEGRSEHKDHPTPVGGLEPVADLLDGSPSCPVGTVEWCTWATAEIERLREALRPFADLADKFTGPMVEVCDPHPNNPSRTIQPLPAIYLEAAFQALGGSHD